MIHHCRFEQTPENTPGPLNKGQKETEGKERHDNSNSAVSQHALPHAPPVFNLGKLDESPHSQLTKALFMAIHFPPTTSLTTNRGLSGFQASNKVTRTNPGSFGSPMEQTRL